MNIVDQWPIVIGFAFLISAAVFQWRLTIVPNSLCLFGLVGALLTAAAASGQWVALGGGIPASLLGFVAGFGLLIPFYNRDLLGAGCVKVQAIFGAWIGCSLPAMECLTAVVLVSAVAAAITLCLGVATFRLMSDEKKANYLFPAQVTLSFGSILGALLFIPFG